jgi:hypothetical protein
MRALFLIVAIAASAAGAGAQDLPLPDTVMHSAKTPTPILTQRGLWAIGGLHVGTPTVLSTSVGAAYGLGPRVHGSLFADVEPGLTAIRFGGGYLLFEDQVAGLGAAVRFARLRAWRQAFGVKRGPWYSGIEGTVMIFLLNVRVGGYVAQSRERDALSLTTVDVGIGF